MKNSKKAETGFKRVAWTQAIHVVKKAAYFLDVITMDKIKNKLYSLKQLWKKWIRLDEKVSG